MLEAEAHLGRQRVDDRKGHVSRAGLHPTNDPKAKAGAYDQWRKDWYDPDDPEALWVEQESKAYILRSVEDPDVVLTFGFLHGDLPELMKVRQSPEVDRKMRARYEAMSESTEEILSDGLYHVVEVPRAGSRP